MPSLGAGSIYLLPKGRPRFVSNDINATYVVNVEDWTFMDYLSSSSHIYNICIIDIDQSR